MFCPPSPPASTGLPPPPSQSLLLLSPPSTIAMSVKCHVVFKVSKDVEKFKAKAVELVKISKVKTKISFTNNSIELAVIENDMCTVNAWVQTDCIPMCVDNPFHCMIGFVKHWENAGCKEYKFLCLLARLTALNLNRPRHIRHVSRCSVPSV